MTSNKNSVIARYLTLSWLEATLQLRCLPLVSVRGIEMARERGVIGSSSVLLSHAGESISGTFIIIIIIIVRLQNLLLGLSGESNAGTTKLGERTCHLIKLMDALLW